MDGIFFEFPLCALSFIKHRDELDCFISYCIVSHTNKLKHGTLKEKCSESAEYFGVSGLSHEARLRKFNAIDSHIQQYISNYGKDSYCRIGKNLLFETRDGQFDFKQFHVLCAISSILGKKKKFARITYDRIRYAMNGYRSKSIFLNENTTGIELLSDKQIKRVVDILHSKKFFSKFTYRNRQIFFSTKLEDEELREAVKSSKIYWKKKQLQLVDKVFSNEIKEELDKLNHINKSSFEKSTSQQSNLRLVKAN